jgi:hypothetical protein
MKKKIENELDHVVVKGMRIEPGQVVKAILHSNQMVEGKVVKLFETTAGIQVRLISEDDSLVWNVEASQIVG